MMRLALLALLTLATPAGAQKASPPVVPFEVPAEPGVGQAVWAKGLERPWGIAFMPDGRALVTERPGRLRIVEKNGSVGPALSGVPQVAALGQGGMLDVSLHPDFARNGLVYLSHSVGTREANMTAVSRGRLAGNTLTDVKELFRNPTAKNGGAHFGSRFLWLPDGTLLVSVGDGGNPNIQLNGQPIRKQAQNPQSYLGKVLRVNADGVPLKDNPGPSGRAAGWEPRVWSIGHRNIQGLARDPKDGAIYATEHAPRGGDELNRLVAGSNYGWPLVTHGVEYSGDKITDERSRPGFRDPLSVWVPSIAPSGLALYRGTALPKLDGALLAGGLVSQDVRVVRLQPDGSVAAETRITIGARVRDVKLGPDGLVYILTDEVDGRIIRLQPASR